jgi:hypothetical protein
MRKIDALFIVIMFVALTLGCVLTWHIPLPEITP